MIDLVAGCLMDCSALSKEVWKLNFRQYGQMEKHHQEEAEPERNSDVEKVRREKI